MTILTTVATIMNAVFDLLAAPFGGSAEWAVFVLSLLTGLAMLLLFKAATNQDRLVAARRVLTGHVYEMGLYQDHLGVLMRIQRDLAVANLRYLRWSLPALVVMLLPMVLILAQLDARYGFRPLAMDETTLVTAALDADQAALLDGLELVAPAGVVVESRPVRDRGAVRATWRVRAAAPGDHALEVRLPDGRAAAKRLVVGDGAPRLARVRERESLRRVLLNPGEAPLPGDLPVASISVRLPERRLSYFGLGLHWLLALVIFSLAFGLAVKDLFRVRF